MRPPRPGSRLALRAIGAAAISALILLPAAASAAPKPADTVLRGATIRTFDARFSVVRALAVRDGRIVYAGGARGVRRFIGEDTRVRNLRGRTVMPGLGDAHIHVLSGGEQLVTCNLEYAALTADQFQARIQKCLDEDSDAGAGDFLRVVNWYRQAMLPAGTDATKATLDALQTERPIVVNSSDGHTTLVNSTALQVAGIAAATPDPPSGRIEHDANGEPTGILEDAAGSLVEEQGAAADGRGDTQEAMAAALKSLAAAGVTAVAHQIATTEALDAYRALRRQGRLTLRVNAAPDVSVEEARRGRRRGRQSGCSACAIATRPDGCGRGPASVCARRASCSRTASSRRPRRPRACWPRTSTRRAMRRASRGRSLLVRSDDAQPAGAARPGRVHAAGARHRRPRGPRDARRLRGRPRTRVGKRPRLSIAHAELVDPADYGRFESLDVTPVMSFQWGKPAPDSIEAAKVFMGPERFDRMEPEGRLQDAGARVTFGSDWPVDALNEFFAIEVGVTRTNDPASGYEGSLNSDPGLSRKEAFRAITANSAYETGIEKRTGSLERGKFADYIVLAEDPMKVPAADISETKVLRTVVGGRTVYRGR